MGPMRVERSDGGSAASEECGVERNASAAQRRDGLEQHWQQLLSVSSSAISFAV
jgi:hypothetical protein